MGTNDATLVVLLEDTAWELSDTIADCLLQSGYWVVRACSVTEAILTVDRYGARIVIAPEARAHREWQKAIACLTETVPSPPRIILVPDGETQQLLDLVARAESEQTRPSAA
jgi:hypothetical protein